jgi:hypothetical protein
VVGNIFLKLVSDNGVVLSKGKQLFTLEIGHSDLSPTTRLAPPAFTTMSRSAALINKAAVAYRAREASTGSSIGSNLNTQQPIKLMSAPAVAVTTGSTPTHNAQPNRSVASGTHNSRPADPAEKSSDKTTDKIVVSTANLIADPNRVISVPADGLSPEIHQASMLVHKKTRVRHNRRRVRHAHGVHRHPARKHHRARPRSHERSFMSRGAE